MAKALASVTRAIKSICIYALGFWLGLCLMDASRHLAGWTSERAVVAAMVAARQGREMSKPDKTKADAIRELGREGLPVAEIARRVGIRYQHARHVLKRSGMLAERSSNDGPAVAQPARASPKPRLFVDDLMRAGFLRAGQWVLAPEGELALSEPLATTPAVYGFVKDGAVLYVGVAMSGLARRFRFYVRPGPRQTTSQRLNARLKDEIASGAIIEVFTASPVAMAWNGLPVCAVTGLEAGLIRAFSPPWNIRGAG